MKTTLLIMAAGIGSRYAGGIKQLAPVGPNGELVMDYSVHDAIRAGFNKLVFVIRKELEGEFRRAIGQRLEAVCRAHDVEIAYAYQSADKIPAGVPKPLERTVPWGTGHAVLMAKDIIHEPFAVINADDFYGASAFTQVHDFLVSHAGSGEYCAAAFLLKNVLSKYSGVTRALCRVDADGYLTDVVETHNIVQTAGGAQAGVVPMDVNCFASMNMWGLTPDYMALLEEGFVQFLHGAPEDVARTEFRLPVHIGRLLQEQRVRVQVLPVEEQWFGLTHLEDQKWVAAHIEKRIATGEYSADLYSDL